MALNAYVVRCIVDGCGADLSGCREYYRRHKVCEIHSKSPVVAIDGSQQRFCQQCSRFHSLAEFDEVKRSCRKRLDDHNRRRRKPKLDAANPSPSFLPLPAPFSDQQMIPSPAFHDSPWGYAYPNRSFSSENLILAPSLLSPPQMFRQDEYADHHHHHHHVFPEFHQRNDGAAPVVSSSSSSSLSTVYFPQMFQGGDYPSTSSDWEP